MRIKLVYLLGALAVIGGLAACQSASPTALPTATRPKATSTPIPQPTSTPAPTRVVAQATPTRQQPAGALLEPTPTRPWQVPEVEATDRAKGGDGAGFVLVEYADYQ